MHLLRRISPVAHPPHHQRGAAHDIARGKYAVERSHHGAEIDRDYPSGPVYLIAILKGACFFLADLARAMTTPARIEFIGISSYGRGKTSSGEVKLTKDPDGRATIGNSSGGSCAMIMAWYHPDLYHRVLVYSGTFINQQWPYDPKTPHGAWEFHEHLIPESSAKPIRIWMEVGDRDLYNPNVMRDNMHDWVLANERMAQVLADKGYHYQFVFARNAVHVDRAVRTQTMPEALEYLWQGYNQKRSDSGISRQVH